MSRFGWYGVEVSHICLVPDLALHHLDNAPILLLKHIRIDAVEGFARLVVLLILCHLVDEEQGQHLDTLVEQLALTLNMRQDCLPYLYTSQLFLADLAHDLARREFETVEKFNGIVAPVDM